MTAMLSPSFMPIIEGLYRFQVAVLAAGLLLVLVVVLIAQKISDKKMKSKWDKGEHHKDK